ncbi:MAG TPA: sigma-54 dependent transcriptional regulator [Fibrobacteria bacterium]|nr:sigma-54 dependent transcriptional regulator [Fibrobacteria bacterium]
MQDTITMTKLILVEDDTGLREQMKWALGEDFQILEADSLASTLACLDPGDPPLICLDMGLEGRSDRGLDVIDAVLSADRNAKIIAVTANPASGVAKEAVRRGAFDYLSKPVDMEGLRNVLERAARMRELESEGEEASSWVPVDPDWPMIGESEPMKGIFSVLRRLSDTDVSVLITGESGTGKELCARAVHKHSRRRNAPFVPINCAAIPDNLLESELFGYVKGAFTGADADKVGLIESAHRGTLFLDEIGDMPLGLQVKLLRFLQDQRLQRVGDTRTRPLDVRIIAATNKANLSGLDDSALRTDLYYRLSEFEIKLPPLRERGRDSLLIAAGILERNRMRFGQPRLRMSSRAEKAVLSYGWPGNVRELENRLNRASITCRGQTIEEEDLQLGDAVAGNMSYREARKAFEKNLLMNALRRSNGNVSLAARTVGVTRPTFYDMMRKTGIYIRTESKV